MQPAPSIPDPPARREQAPGYGWPWDHTAVPGSALWTSHEGRSGDLTIPMSPGMEESACPSPRHGDTSRVLQRVSSHFNALHRPVAPCCPREDSGQPPSSSPWQGIDGVTCASCSRRLPPPRQDQDPALLSTALVMGTAFPPSPPASRSKDLPAPLSPSLLQHLKPLGVAGCMGEGKGEPHEDVT